METWEYIREMARCRRKEFTQARLRGKERLSGKIPQWRKTLKRNEIFIKVFSTIFSSIVLAFLGFMVSYWGYRLNARNVEISEMNAELNKQNVEINEANGKLNKQNAEISKRQLEILENDKRPYFVLKSENIWDENKLDEDTGRVFKTRYTITNEGGIIANANIIPKIYLFLAVPSGELGKYYVFKYSLDAFSGSHQEIGDEEKLGRKFVFYEYASERYSDENFGKIIAIMEYLSNCFDEDIFYAYANFVRISYNDYMREHHDELFEFGYSSMWQSCIPENMVDVGVGLGVPRINPKDGSVRSAIDIEDNQAVAEAIAEEIEEWLKENEGLKGQALQDSYSWRTVLKYGGSTYGDMIYLE